MLQDYGSSLGFFIDFSMQKTLISRRGCIVNFSTLNRNYEGILMEVTSEIGVLNRDPGIFVVHIFTFFLNGLFLLLFIFMRGEMKYFYGLC